MSKRKPSPKPRQEFRELGNDFGLSFVHEAPDHKQPELALVDCRQLSRRQRRRYGVVATGTEAEALWRNPPPLEELLVLAGWAVRESDGP